ncbi:MAG: YbgF trimerization domain-containing protein, partial [Saprospiraceae bacterium]|nr:YbgF trimerization domain-containing protein [Saprospiraceae bacterium]
MTKRLFAGVLLSSLVLCAQAQSTGPLAVEDRSTARSMANAAADQTAAAPAASSISEDGLLMLMQQQQQFEEQIQMLQGQIEELRHEIQVMKDAERERYLDL